MSLFRINTSDHYGSHLVPHGHILNILTIFPRLVGKYFTSSSVFSGWPCRLVSESSSPQHQYEHTYFHLHLWTIHLPPDILHLPSIFHHHPITPIHLLRIEPAERLQITLNWRIDKLNYQTALPVVVPSTPHRPTQCGFIYNSHCRGDPVCGFSISRSIAALLLWTRKLEEENRGNSHPSPHQLCFCVRI